MKRGQVLLVCVACASCLSFCRTVQTLETSGKIAQHLSAPADNLLNCNSEKVNISHDKEARLSTITYLTGLFQ